MKCTPFVRQYAMPSDEWGVYMPNRKGLLFQIISPLVSQIHQNFFFFMTQRQTNTTATLTTMTAG